MRKPFDKNHRYTLDELDCQYCVYHQKKKKGENARCAQEACCCTGEKREALGEMQADIKPAHKSMLKEAEK